MWIVGGKDYYDSGLAYGVDESVVFVRTGRKLLDYEAGFLREFQWWGSAPGISIPEKSKARRAERSVWQDREYGARVTSWWHEGTSYYAEGVQVILCGRYYGGVRIRSYKPPYGAPTRYEYERIHTPSHWNSSDWKTETFWDQNSASRFLAKCGAQLENSRGKFRGDRPESRAFYRAALPQHLVDKMVEARITVATRCSSDCEQVKAPGERYSNWYGVWRVDDDTLKNVTFAKVLDPVTCFQEIEMWVGGVLPKPGNPMVEITDDKIKAAKHGMDKWSFRRMPEKTK